ncbi:1-phosphatidylinositol 4,5-bisphosphate phosphodiesterase beta-1-like [Hydractinia symbiolongicarpus]|uniref:1-phosphatidylinositol 4,5-bisphosphate phosphodiesterase beta-1-like n=1 Tax=Hydractinia symbiolongicarpus TaxID=13093 RepID=UPI00254A33E6|nr:1-phosphatidylinositol 4,5-bisphosphate phosphodiesterase beta-1-like [Hydractinia symbiolongicarpus]
MAGAGPVTEKLPVVAVPPKLSNGGRFLKWDDNDASCSVYILEVDPEGNVLYWKPEDYSKDTEVLELVHIRDVRTGQYAKAPRTTDNKARETIRTFCAFEQESNCIQERTITIVYGPNMVDVSFVNFVATSISEAEEWTNALFKCTNNLLELNASPLKCLKRFYTRIYVQKNKDGEVPAKLLVKNYASSKEDKKRAYETLQSVGLASGKKDTIKVKDFTFDNFVAFHSRLVTRQDLDGVFAELGAKKKPYLTLEQLVDFLNNRQRDPRLNEILYPYYNIERAQAIINSYESNTDFADKGYISIDGLTRFLMSSDNPILLQGKLQIHEDLTFPIAHYFINSSHNTYLTGHQLTGKSSVEIYRQVLLAGCRCIELDCWDGKTEEQEPVITHGMTLCTEVPFKDVVEAIAESAFKTSEYPVILSFENHCSAKQQQKMASYCLQILGDLLLNKALEEFPLEPGSPLPSPKALKRKILIKNKKRAVKVVSVSDVKSAQNPELVAQPSVEILAPNTPMEMSVLDDLPEDTEVKEVVPKSEEEEQPEVEAQQELSDLVNYFQPVHFRGFDRAEKAKKFYEMSSFSENAAMNLLKEQPVEFVNYNKFQPSRIYPKGSRVSSDNYNPQLFWNAGCQFAALNFQTLDLPMMLNLGKFEMNGRCGYLLKPEHMRRSDRTFDPFVESTVDGIIAGTVHVRVISGQCLSERRCGTYVEVEVYGLPVDTVRRKYRTKVVSNNGLNPIYDEEPFKFKVVLPHLAELRIAAYEDNGKMIGHRILPVIGLSPGYRHIKLRNDAYQPLCLPTLFVDIVTKDFVPESFSDFADALANPMKYLSEKEKRTEQLKKLEMEEGVKENGENTQEKPPGPELNVPLHNPNKRGSIISIPAIMNNPTKDTKRSDSIPKNDFKGNKRNMTVPPVKIPENEPIQRSFSAAPELLSKIRDEMLDLNAPDVSTLMEHKLYVKIRQKHDAEMQTLLQKHAKDRAKINKDLEVESKKLKIVVEKEKSVLQKKHSKILKSSEKDSTYTETYNECRKEIDELNNKHDKEIERMTMEQRSKVKEQYMLYYEEQMNLAKSQVEPKIAELKKVMQQIEMASRKRLLERHNREMVSLKKEQDKYNRSEIKELTRKFKDKSEAQKEKRAHNKKHIDQSVKEIQKMQDFQRKETELLAQQYEEATQLLEDKYSEDMKELESFYEGKCALLDTQDLQKLIPILLPAVPASSPVSNEVKFTV